MSTTPSDKAPRQRVGLLGFAQLSLRILIRLLLLGIIAVVVLAAILGSSSSSKKKAVPKLSLASSCTDWARAAPADRRSFANGLGNGLVGSTPDYAQLVVQNFALFCLRAHTRHAEATTNLSDAPLPKP